MRGGLHGVLQDDVKAENGFVDEQNFEDNGQITAIELRVGSEEIYAIRARLITYLLFKTSTYTKPFEV